MVAKVLAQIVVTGVTIFGRAFVEAYRHAAANAAKSGAEAAASRPGASPLTRRTGMTLDEAEKILHVNAKEMPLEAIAKRYQQLFEMNNPKKGGSFYLQSKIFRAKERIELERGEEAKVPTEETATEKIDSGTR